MECASDVADTEHQSKQQFDFLPLTHFDYLSVTMDNVLPGTQWLVPFYSENLAS